jgi:dTDP-N-acetylfucosamine:lipid II N-acetylfucosaminyltransferase
MKKIVHLLPNSVYTVRFIDFMNKYFPKEEHDFLVVCEGNSFKVNKQDNVFFIKKKSKDMFFFHKELFIADKIILHGIFTEIVPILFIRLGILKKCYWVIWGGDLYYHETRVKSFRSNLGEFMRRIIIKNMGVIITNNEGEYELARKWYPTKARHMKAFYPSPIVYEDLDFDDDYKEKSLITILVGNSANPTNNHIEVLNKLLKFKDEDIEIIAPLSYGEKEWAKKVIETGEKLFGDKFKPLVDFLPPAEYARILNSVDIAVFNHNRQQALGNIKTLLYLGKKVYIRKDVTTWDYFERIGITVYDTYGMDKLSFEEFVYMEESLKAKNREIIGREFSEERCRELWEIIFNS